MASLFQVFERMNQNDIVKAKRCRSPSRGLARLNHRSWRSPCFGPKVTLSRRCQSYHQGCPPLKCPSNLMGTC